MANEFNCTVANLGVPNLPVGDNGDPSDNTKSECGGSTARVDHGIADCHCGARRENDRGASRSRCKHGIPGWSVFQARSQMERGASGKVEKPRLCYLVCRILIQGIRTRQQRDKPA